MQVRWIDENCVRIEGKEITVVINPSQTMLDETKVLPGIVASSATSSNEAPSLKVEDSFLIDSPGEYEVGSAFVIGVAGAGQNQEEAVEAGNQALCIELDSLRICHLGLPTRALSQSDIESIGQVDLLILPVGDDTSVAPPKAAEIVGQIEPSLVLPIAHQGGDDPALGAFCKVMGQVPDAEHEPAPSLDLNPNRLPDETQITILRTDDAN